MEDFHEIKSKVVAFLKSNERVLGVTGWYDDKVYAVISAINDDSYFCDFDMYIPSIDTIKNALKKLEGIKKAQYIKPFQYKNMKINFKKYIAKKRLYTSESKLAVIYPVQSVLIRMGEDWNNILEIINNNKIEKVIIVTTNDHNLNLLPLESVCDVVIRNDGKRDDPDTWNNVSSHLERKNK